MVRTFKPKKAFGTVLVGIGFSSYLSPVLKTDVDFTPSHKDKSHVKYTTRGDWVVTDTDACGAIFNV